jgi:hypothetical protein
VPRAIATLTAVLAALALGACGGSSGPTPTEVGEQWYRATAAGDGTKLCALSTAERRSRFLEIGKRLQGGKNVSTCAAAVELTLDHFGGKARLGKFAHVRVRLVSKSNGAAVVQAEKAAPLNLVRSGSSWLVAGASAASGASSG